MKKTRSILATVIMLIIIATSAKAQNNTAELKIKTSATCDMCKTTIEKYMAFEKGVKKSELDVASKILTVTYNPQKTTPGKLRIAVSKSGYDADDVKADPKAFAKLEECCRKGQVCTEVK